MEEILLRTLLIMKPNPLLPPVTNATYPLTPKRLSILKADIVNAGSSGLTLGVSEAMPTVLKCCCTDHRDVACNLSTDTVG